MPYRIEWTPEADRTIIRMRSERASWNTIRTALGHSYWTIIERDKKIGAELPPPVEAEPEPDPDRDPLPPGHPDTWGPIIARTCLAGVPYPHPVYA